MRWRILNKKKQTDIIKILLKNRGLKTKKQQEEFLAPKDPYKLTAKEVGINDEQIKKAITRIKKAIKSEENIIIYGDYDTDGVCATAILWQTLYGLKANVIPFIPTREEGYGMKVARIEQLVKEEVKLIITVDQGIVAYAAAARAKELGIDLIITDHHVLGEKKPKTLAIIHTTKLAGAGVAWFFAQKILKAFGKKSRLSLDLATIATVTDVVPLVGPNRSVVKFGLAEVRKTKRPGLISLYENAAIKPDLIGTYEIGYLIGPRLNASGRMDDPMDSLRLICTWDEKAAKSLAAKLERKNQERQKLAKELSIFAREKWLKEDGKSNLIFVADEIFQQGVVGLVAGKLMEEFYRPAVVVAKMKQNSRASARSIDEFNILEAVRACADIIGPHGGHKKAAGFSVATSKIEIVRQRLVELAEDKLKDIELIPTLKIDTEIDLADLNWKLYQNLEKIAPYGEANPSPVFATRGITIKNTRLIGKDNNHLKLSIIPSTSSGQVGSKSNVVFDAVGFNLGHFYPQLTVEKPVDIAYNLTLNEWNGKKSLQLKIKDIKSSV